MKKFDSYIQSICAIAIVISLIVYFMCMSPRFFDRRRIALSDIRRSCYSHESAATKATNDFKKDNLYVFLRGLADYDKEEEKRMMDIEKTYGVTYLDCGCMGCGEFTNTYEQVMNHLINEKYKKMVFRTIDVYFLDYLKQNKIATPMYMY